MDGAQNFFSAPPCSSSSQPAFLPCCCSPLPPFPWCGSKEPLLGLQPWRPSLCAAVPIQNSSPDGSARCRLAVLCCAVSSSPSTLTGWSLFCAAPNRAVETRGEKTLAALAAIIFVFLCSVKLLNGCVCV
jgi:hypothetical protein